MNLEFNTSEWVWELVDVENEVIEEPKNQLLENINALLSSEVPQYIGSATELIEKLGCVDTISTNTITRTLNINVDRLLNEYNIKFESKRVHSGRQLILSRI